ncbi:uncharacterized protein LOC134854334 [Symsagittifera roscoffensis]|uniref:uncharacterized protein LOC134854334 n=1 Tax=Symsagittifera roscoffensis TaxID=84072 RepID=UPI00307BC18A
MSNRRESSATDGAGSKHGGGGRGGVGSASLPPVKLGDELPLQWRCVGDVNIEKRLHSSFETWKFDVQCQIANMGRKIDKLTRENNLSDLGGVIGVTRSEEEERKHQKIVDLVAQEYREQFGLEVIGGATGSRSGPPSSATSSPGATHGEMVQ